MTNTETTAFTFYRRGKIKWVKFSIDGNNYDCTVDSAKEVLVGVGLFLFLLFLITRIDE